MTFLSVLQYLTPETVARIVEDLDENSAGDERVDLFTPIMDLFNVYWSEEDRVRFNAECRRLALADSLEEIAK